MKELIEKIEIYEAENKARFYEILKSKIDTNLATELGGLIGTMEAQINLIKSHLKYNL